MSIAVGLLGGLLGSLVLRRMLRPLWAAPVLARVNVRGVVVPTAGGLVLVVVLLVAGAVRTVVDGGAMNTAVAGAWGAAMLVAAGLGLVGLVDDLVGSVDPAGFGGHLRALAGGRVTTGMVKLLGGGAVAVVAAGLLRPRPGQGAGWLLVDAAVIALAANLVNLFDCAPGRAGKLGVLTGGALLVAGARPSLVPAAVVVGGVAGLLSDDLRERLMLGDTGSNALGGVLGAGLVVVASQGVRLGALVVLAALNAVSEVVSFSRMIDGISILRALDRAGRPRCD